MVNVVSKDLLEDLLPMALAIAALKWISADSFTGCVSHPYSPFGKYLVVVMRWRWGLVRGMWCCLFMRSAVSRSRCVRVVPLSVAMAVRWVPKSLVSLRTCMVAWMGVHMSERSV